MSRFRARAGRLVRGRRDGAAGRLVRGRHDGGARKRRAVLVALLVAFGPATAAVAADRPLDTSPPDGLSVYTTPDPSPVASTAYVYSPAVLSAPPMLRVTGPGGQVAVVQTTFSHDAAPGAWWTAPLPGGAAGIRQVVATAATADGRDVRGASSYEIVKPTTSSGGSQWHASGPGAVGGLFAADPFDPRTLYVASPISAELQTSDDTGATWRMQRTLPVAGGYPTALLAIAGPGHRTRLLLSVNGSNGLYVEDPTYTGKVLESDDGGRHWRDLQMPDSFVVSLVASADGSTLVAVTKSGVQVTTDGGAHWRTAPDTWGSANINQAALVDDDLYVATFTGLYVMRDVSSSDSAPVLGFVPPDGRSKWVTSVAGDADTIFANAWPGSVFASHDHGLTWTHVHDTSGAMLLFQVVAGTLYTEAGTVLTVTSDGGATWHTEPLLVPGGYYDGVAAVGHRIYLSTTDAGIYASDNGGASYHAVAGVPGLDAFGVAVSRGRVIAGTPSDTYATTVANAARSVPLPWTDLSPQMVSGTAVPVVAASPDGSVVYKVRSGPRIGTYTTYSSRDGGATWQQLRTVNGNVGALLVDPADPDDVYVSGSSGFTGDTLNVSRDGGQTWTSVSVPENVVALAGDPTDPDKIWLGGSTGLAYSVDGGETFTLVDSTAVGALTVLASHRVIVAGAQLRYTDDDGRTMHVARQPKLDVSFSAAVASPRSPGTVFAASNAFHEAGFRKGGHGVLVSTDGGRSWSPYRDGLDDLDVTSLAITPDGNQLFAGTVRGGVYTIALPKGHVLH